ncbi:D-2-hydroxyacid dehydrogenase [Legionella jordanis]|uniref:2-hydroxyacid dehydrogenase n=2 Tax=Legionella TaxID=445 RepID=A0A0W0V9M2_9GAMM|nr:D-2-hydroxyacid dehydrogenase [Legionella jordanis]KTD16783.1 2-hydroxyacid dehydrogenase [Legionella jordanis]RMX03689.1 D-2-hydroxyacid dehydrogenase [Legionella jordanis]RMX22249.1 D-2-hydroxyacid dehydrogenase [Legionella jordanis]VEH11749.1 2-hydroxyacid dehydrogenase [Legionella jordanis]HAT8712941.1 D-2-hydroxyacid dehydrogenase [Legionella jordanis]
MNNPNIVVLDAIPLINDGLCLDRLYELGEVRLYDKTSDEQIIERALNADMILINKVKLGERHFSQLPKLRYIGETATGVDNIDLVAAAKYNISVTNVPSYSAESVAQHVLALLLSHSNQVSSLNASVQRGAWQKQDYFSYWDKPITELTDLTLGLLGFGKIAQKVAHIAQAFGMRIIFHKPNFYESSLASWVSLSELLEQSDVLSLHCPLNDNTRNIINAISLKKMKKPSVLINTSRGGLIDEQALAQALKHGEIQAAYLDVLSQEPPPDNHPLIGLDNCVITPHVAWASVAARKRLLNEVCQNIIHFLNNKPINLVRV